jgi:carbon storage regulator
MLVLTRRVGQSIHIGDDIVIMVTRVGSDNVRIGISAPRDVQVIRDDAGRKEPRNAEPNSQPD